MLPIHAVLEPLKAALAAAPAVVLAAPPGATLPDHVSLLKLSRDADMRRRIVTTNFDTLFEHAARQGGLGDLG